MLHFIGFILILALILIIFVVVGFLGLFRAVFGRKLRRSVRRRSEQAAEAHHPRQKVFDDNEGEYVEFEEISNEDSLNR